MEHKSYSCSEMALDRSIVISCTPKSTNPPRDTPFAKWGRKLGEEQATTKKLWALISQYGPPTEFPYASASTTYKLQENKEQGGVKRSTVRLDTNASSMLYFPHLKELSGTSIQKAELRLSFSDYSPGGKVLIRSGNSWQTPSVNSSSTWSAVYNVKEILAKDGIFSDVTKIELKLNSNYSLTKQNESSYIILPRGATYCPPPGSYWGHIGWVLWNTGSSENLGTTFTGMNRPKITSATLDIDYTPAPFEAPSSLSPDNQVINPRIENRFSWNTEAPQGAYEWQWRENSSSDWKGTGKVISNSRFHIVPANTITKQSGSIDWRVRVWGEDPSVPGSFWTTAYVELGTLPQKPPALLYPNEAFVRETEIVFSWHFIPNSIEVQKAWELEYKIGSGEWVHVEGTDDGSTYTLQKPLADTTNAYWRMRVQNQFGDWSEWTKDTFFTLVGVPALPQIFSVSDENSPLVKWSSSDQSSYQLRVYDLDKDLMYSSGNVISLIDREHRVLAHLSPGNYRLTLTVKNDFDVQSPVAEYNFAISENDLAKPSIKLFEGEYYIHIKSEPNSVVLRDGVEIGKTDENGDFEDFAVKSGVHHKYTARFLAGNKFKDSDQEVGIAFFGADTLALAEDPKEMAILYLTDKPDNNRAESIEIESSKIQLEGLIRPFVEFGLHEEKIIERNYHLEKNEYSLLLDLVRKRRELLYRDREGWNEIVALTSINVSQTDLGFTIKLSLQVVSDREA